MSVVLDLYSLKDFAKDFTTGKNTSMGFTYVRMIDKPEEAGKWGYFYTHHRDSGALERVNAAVIESRLAPFTGDSQDDPDAIPQRFGHCAYGFFEGYAIRVYRQNGDITDAARELYAIARKLADYPILDEDKLAQVKLDEQWQSWRSYGRRDFLNEMERLDYQLDGDDGRAIEIDFSDVEPNVLDAFITEHRLTDFWEHDDDCANLNVDIMAANAAELGLDAIISGLFTDRTQNELSWQSA